MKKALQQWRAFERNLIAIMLHLLSLEEAYFLHTRKY